VVFSSAAERPIPAVRGTATEPLESTHLRPSCPRQRLVGEPRKRSFASDFWLCWRRAHVSSSSNVFASFRVGSFEPLGEPAVNGRPQVARFGPPAQFKLRSGRAIGGEPFAKLGDALFSLPCSTSAQPRRTIACARKRGSTSSVVKASLSPPPLGFFRLRPRSWCSAAAQLSATARLTACDAFGICYRDIAGWCRYDGGGRHRVTRFREELAAMADRGHADPDQVVGRQLARTSATTSLSRSDGSYCRAPAHAANFRCPRPKASRYR
jgi:hypothetical protein